MLEGGAISQKVKILIYALLIVVLLIIYCVQIKGFNVQAGIVFILMAAGAGLTYANKDEEQGGFSDTLIAGVLGYSIGLVISNSQIQLI